MSIAFHFETKVFKITISVGIAIGEVHLVIFINKSIVPGQSIVRLIVTTALTISILIVLYVLSPPVPAKIFLLRLTLRINDNFHAHFVQIVHFVVIEYIESHFMVFEGIWDFEEKPLGVAICIDVILQ